ncbi:MAG: Glycosyl transferase family 2 [Microgenomates group bacterium GW2011_GWC2_46_7]|nr:MAG: Glycosyl transferase family 2 [Microgenomates group bacterium GW2011_GWC2_46_7]
MKPLISVILPNYNELENLERGVLGIISAYFSTQVYGWEVIISDDGSTDESVKFIEHFIASYPGFRLVKNPHAGKPYALKAAIKIARGQYVLFTDMDQSTPIDQLDKLLPYTKDGFRIVIGSRGVRRRDSSLIRQLASVIFLLARKIFLLRSIKDTQCGFKLLETKLATKIFSRMRLFGRSNQVVGWKVTAYDVEMLYLAEKLEAEIQEVRVVWRDEDTSSDKRRNFIKESIEMFLEILRVSLNDMLGKYE